MNILKTYLWYSMHIVCISYVCVCTLNMHMYVYYSYNESKNYNLNIEICYSNLKIVISFLSFKYEFLKLLVLF
jgi:hypothetical protein